MYYIVITTAFVLLLAAEFVIGTTRASVIIIIAIPMIHLVRHNFLIILPIKPCQTAFFADFTHGGRWRINSFFEGSMRSTGSHLPAMYML